MKIYVILFITALLIACSTTQSLKKDSQSEATSNNSYQNNDHKSAVSIGEEPPYVIRKAPLKYPRFAQSNRIEGIVILKVEIFADGTVGRVVVTKSVMSDPCILSEAAIKSVKKWIFKPAIYNGEPVACWTTFPVEFRIK